MTIKEEISRLPPRWKKRLQQETILCSMPGITWAESESFALCRIRAEMRKEAEKKAARKEQKEGGALFAGGEK